MDYSKPPLEVIVDLLLENHPGEILEPDWLAIDTVEVIDPTPDIPRNTKILVKSTVTSEYYGDKVYYYNRLNIVEFLFEGLITPDDLTIDPGFANTTSQLAGLLSDVLKIHLDDSMIVPEALPIMLSNQEYPITIFMSPNNPVFIGQLSVILKRA